MLRDRGFQALSSVYDSQVLCASHSPAVLALAEPHQLLCFARTPAGATTIIRGAEHPLLQSTRPTTLSSSSTTKDVARSVEALSK